MDPSDQDFMSRDTINIGSDTRTPDHSSNEPTRELQDLDSKTVAPIPHPSSTLVECDEVAGEVPGRNPSQRVKSEPDNKMDGLHELPEKKVIPGENAPTRRLPKVSSLSSAMERMSIAGPLDERYWLGNGKKAADVRRTVPSSLFDRRDAYRPPGNDDGIECFVGDCGTKKSFLSVLLYATLCAQTTATLLISCRRHAETAHDFFYCNECCEGFSTQKAKRAYLPQCSNFCMSPSCVADDAAVSRTGNPQSQRHIRTQECPTVGRVEIEHKLEFWKYLYESVYPEGTEPATCQ